MPAYVHYDTYVQYFKNPYRNTIVLHVGRHSPWESSRAAMLPGRAPGRWLVGSLAAHHLWNDVMTDLYY